MCQIYIVSDGKYPFTNKIGTVAVVAREDKEKEAEQALLRAKQVYGGHPTVERAEFLEPTEVMQ